jgi:hypothetical protein
MKHLGLILLTLIWLGLGCGTVKSWFGSDSKPHEEMPFPPNSDEVKYDKNGNPIFTDDQLAFNDKPFNWKGIMFATGLFTVTALAARHFIKND